MNDDLIRKMVNYLIHSLSVLSAFETFPIMRTISMGDILILSVLEDPTLCAGKPCQENSLILPCSQVLQPHSSEVGFINHMLILKLSKQHSRQDS
ncbi:hypothetical protein Tco_1193193 [Tanacetum coccineum]